MKINRAELQNITKKTYLEYMKLFPVLKKERNQQYGMLIFTFATMTFFGIFAINPTLTTIVTLQRSLKDAKFAHEQLTEKISSLSILQNKYTQLGADLSIIENAVPPTINATRFMGQLQSIIRTSGVTPSGITFGALTLASQSLSPEGDFTFALQVKGSFSQVDAFINDLTSLERIVTVDSLAISKEEIGGSGVVASLNGAAHYKK